MRGDAPLPLPLSPNGLTLRGLDLQTDLYYLSSSVRTFFAQWVGRVGIEVHSSCVYSPSHMQSLAHMVPRACSSDLGAPARSLHFSLLSGLGVHIHPFLVSCLARLVPLGAHLSCGVPGHVGGACVCLAGCGER